MSLIMFRAGKRGVIFSLITTIIITNIGRNGYRINQFNHNNIMAEGGLLRWKVQKVVTAPTLSYDNLQKELKAPKGQRWVYDSTTREWSLEVVPMEVVTADVVDNQDVVVVDAVVVKESSSSSSTSNFSPFLEHLVQPTDTFEGICLRYKVTPTELRQANDFTGTNLFLAPNPLKIPRPIIVSTAVANNSNNNETKEDVPRALTTDQVVSILLKNCPKLSKSEARAYLELSDWDIAEAVTKALEDGF